LKQSECGETESRKCLLIDQRQVIFKQKKKETLKSSGTNKKCSQRKTITLLFHTLHSIFLFLSSNFFFVLCSIYPLLLLFSFLLTPLYLCPLSLGLKL